MTILITGANGFIGKALRSRLASGNKVIGVDITGPADEALNVVWEQADLTDGDSAGAICEKYSPDVVIHCAGIAHQKIGAVDFDTYMRVNSKATENLANATAKTNPMIEIPYPFPPKALLGKLPFTFYPFLLKADLGKNQNHERT